MTIAMTIYVLIWPVIVAVILAVLIRGFYLEVREARRRGEPLV